MANKVVEDTFRHVEEALAKLRNVIDQHEALQKDIVKEQPKSEDKPKTK